MSELLGDILRSVSRAFYLTLRVLPPPVRWPIATAYLLARAADTIADSRWLAGEQRLGALLELREQILGLAAGNGLRLQPQGGTPGEQALLRRLPEAVALLGRLEEKDRQAVRDIVSTLISGMEADLRHFPEGRLSALEEAADLDRHTYFAAGCVGEFWTRILVAHVEALADWDLERMSRLGVRFGKALQLTNVLRDLPRDLAEGRCYLPSHELAQAGLSPANLLEHPEQLRPVLRRWISLALEHYRCALVYTLAIPWHQLRLRLAVLWPILMGLATLEKLAALPRPEPVKVSRPWVYRMMLLSLPCAPFDWAVRAWVERALGRVESQLS